MVSREILNVFSGAKILWMGLQFPLQIPVVFLKEGHNTSLSIHYNLKT